MSFELLPEGRDGVLVLWKVQLDVCEQVGMLLDEVVDTVQSMVCAHVPRKGAG
jgi:hypothetical protein